MKVHLRLHVRKDLMDGHRDDTYWPTDGERFVPSTLTLTLTLTATLTPTLTLTLTPTLTATLGEGFTPSRLFLPMPIPMPTPMPMHMHMPMPMPEVTGECEPHNQSGDSA